MTVAFVASFAFTINHWGECETGCPAVEHAFERLNSFLLCLVPSLLVAGALALGAERRRGE